jgi:DNA-binding response OmpR family regulator
MVSGFGNRRSFMAVKTKILVVEDEPAVAGLMTFLLTREGYDVQTAFTGKAGMELAITRKFGLILSDINLPAMNGLDLCRELKQRHIPRLTPIILLSGNDHEARRAKALELGAVDFIAKPFDVAQFISRIRSNTVKEVVPI